MNRAAYESIVSISGGSSTGNMDEWARRYRRAGTAPARMVRKARRRVSVVVISASEAGHRTAKRVLDIVFSLLLLIVMRPLFALIALAIALTDGGPVLYWQERVGIWGETFAFPKFRSMVVKAEQMVDHLQSSNHHGASITFKMK